MKNLLQGQVHGMIKEYTYYEASILQMHQQSVICTFVSMHKFQPWNGRKFDTVIIW